MQKAYYIYTLSATEIIKNCYSSKKELPEKIELDLNNKFIYDSVVKSFELFPESAFFHQLEQSIIGYDKNKKTDDNILSEHLVFVDFENLFSNSTNATMKKYIDVIEEYFFEDVKNEDLNRGLHIKFYKQEKFTRLIPFDKSNSMARNSRMSFLDFDYKEDMNNRIMLDIEMEQAALNKLYAYRGLYLTAATRIEPQENIFELNEKTVVVIDDDVSSVKIKRKNKIFNILTAKIDETKIESDDKKKTEVYKKWIGETKDTKVELNRFDGEGLISFGFRNYIVHTLGDDAYSFQVRLPFGKGMLHTVDFHRMIKEALRSDNLNGVKIKDAFGIDRDLSEAQIILTKSMFKCFYWLKSFCEKKHHGDPMKYYFEKMEKYNHSLYISNTDAMLKNETKKVTLSYQFLNPMKLELEYNENSKKKNRLQEIVTTHFEDAGKIKNNKYYQKQGAKREQAEQIAENSEREEIAEKTETWLAVLSEDNRVIKEPKIAGKLNGMYQSQLKNTVFGKLVVEGELRFLSRDLVALCYHLVKKCGEKTHKKAKEFFVDEILLFDEKISIPGRAIAVECGANLALFRNPHLSRNEEWLSQYFENDFRKKYLGHLKGVVEIGYNSIANLALGGADFDGDLVKIIKDSAVVEAVKDGCYIEEKGEIKRNIPVIEIPGTPKPKELSVNDYTMNFEVIKRTFSSRIGEISNATINAGYFQYKKEDERLNENNICAMATILTGLEIDSCKNGEKPDIKPVTKFWDDEKKDDASKTISTSEQTEQPKVKDGVLGATKTEKAYSKKFDYIKQKNEIEKMDAVKIQVEEKNQKATAESPEKRGYEIYTSKNINKMFIPYMEEDEEKKFADIDKLFYYYAKKKVEDKETKKEQNTCASGKNDNETTKKESLFEKLTKEEKKKDKYNEIKDIVSAYNDVMSLSSQVYKTEKLHHESRYLKQINSILQLQYDDGVDEKHINSILNFFESFIEDKHEKTFCGAKVGEIEKKIKEITKEEIEWLINDKWQNMRGANKTEKLKEKYGEKLKEEQIALLTNFDCGGYQLLYLFLKEAILDFKESTSNNLDLNEVPSDAKKEENVYFKIYQDNKSKKVPKSTWKKELIKKAREDLKEMFGADFISSLRYVYAVSKTIDKNGNFFWDVFTAEEILTAIKKKEGASDAE